MLCSHPDYPSGPTAYTITQLRDPPHRTAIVSQDLLLAFCQQFCHWLPAVHMGHYPRTGGQIFFLSLAACVTVWGISRPRVDYILLITIFVF